MALSSVLVANLFTGLTSTAWTIWLSVFVVIGIVVQWIYTVSVRQISELKKLI